MRLALITLTVTALAAPSLRAQAPVEAPVEGGLETRVWLDRGEEPVLKRGETVRIYYRTTEDAYAAIFRIDTDGAISLIMPQQPESDEVVQGGRDYRLVLPTSPVWRVSEDPGVGYFFMIASPEPLDLGAFPFDPDFGWDLSAVGGVVYEDPYVAIDEYVAQLIPNWEATPYALDFITYNVGDTHTYPRFLCYDCHDARPYATWNPYSVACTTYRVVIWDDPYFYPYYRYSGSSVVVARPLVTQPRYAVAARSAGDSYRPLVRSRPGPPRRGAEFKEPATAGTRDATPRRASAQPSRSAPRPTLQRRPTSSRLPVRTPPRSSATTRPAPARQGTSDARIVRPSRPSAPSASRPSAPVTNRTPATARPSPGATRTPTTRGGAVRTRPSAPARQPSRQPSAGSRPSARPSVPARQPSTRSRQPTAQPRPSRPSARPAAPSRPPARSPAPSRPRAQPSAPSRPSARPAAPSRAPTSRPTVRPRSNDSGRRPGG